MAKITKIAQRSLMAAAALAAMAGSVQAQSVTIYGRVDVGFEYVSDDADDESLSSLQNGGILPSIWGFRGSEDLGGGLKAVFNLEGDFDASTGGNRFSGALNLFGRQANVGLSGGFGTVLLGRQYSPALLADLGTEPRGFKESFSALLPYALQQAPDGNAVSGNNFLGIFTGNMISYSTSFGPVNLGVGYGFGEQAGETSEGSTVALGLTYNGPITVSGSYQKIEGINGGGSTDAESQRFSLGVAVPFGAMTFKAYYAAAEIDDVFGDKISDTDFFGVGVNWAWNAQNTLTVAYYMGEDDEIDDSETSDLVISNDYALSKRTTFYTQFIYTDNDGGSTATSIAADRSVKLDDSSYIISIGLKHDF